ncbi:MAG: hypothetical protein GY847_37735 [Proteobacteria bacterium]|nr:hypothetical protein [Pseudomonadota bacterium]
MTKFDLLLLDAGVILHLFELDLWIAVLDRCNVYLVGTVITEAKYWEDDDGNRHPINWSEYDGRYTRIDVPIADIKRFNSNFERSYFEKLDPGESEALAYLCDCKDEDALISSGDAIVYRVLGNIDKQEQGVSLEEIFGRLGMSRKVDWPYSKRFRLEKTRKGFEENLQGYGRIKK